VRAAGRRGAGGPAARGALLNEEGSDMKITGIETFVVSNEKAAKKYEWTG
jgi:hypothetical protein